MKKNLAIAIFAFVVPLLFNSGAFASPLTGLTEAEQDYHDKVFDYVMDNINADNRYDWKSFSGNGSITVGKPFISKSNSNCREFTENYTVQGSDGKSKGYGCKRSGNDGWCRLKSDLVLTCALEQPAYSFGVSPPPISGPSMSAPNVEVGNISGPNVNININTPNVDVPNMHAPNLSGGGGGSQQGTNQGSQQKKGDVKPGQASGTAYSVTDTLGNGAAKGTGMAVGWFQNMFR